MDLDGSDSSAVNVNTGPSDTRKPFDASAQADVILRSSDSVDFFVLKAILCLVSPVFNSMFSITQESNDGESKDETKNGLPVVDLAEDSITIYNLLFLLYPYAKGPANTLEVYTSIAEAAEKYAMDEIIQELKKLVMSCDEMVKEPMATFGVAVRFGWVEVMREAALNTLAIPLRNLISGNEQDKYLHFIGVVDYRVLLSWHFACQDALSKIFQDWVNHFDFWEDDGEPIDVEWHIRSILAPHLLKRLKETGCAGPMVLMDDRDISRETWKAIFNKYSPREYSDARESMMKDIQKALSTVPLKINGIVVQNGD